MKKRRKRSRSKWIPHVDDDWINEKIGSHGGLYEFKDPRGLAVIKGIGSKNCLQIFGYNIILFFKYLNRKLRKR